MEVMVVEVDSSFKLEKAVCNHGFFMMAPNRWIPSKKCLIRPLRVVDITVTVSITQHPTQHFVVINYSRQQQLHRQAIRDQVARMLRISGEDEIMVQEFHKVHPEAKQIGFARLFRSPTLFEDIIKSLLLCNCSWGRSLEMAQSLCNLEHKLSKSCKMKRKRSCTNDDDLREDCWFPSPKTIACLDEETLNKHCKLGYRARIILQVATNVQDGNLNLTDFNSHQFLAKQLIKIKGFGPFTIANVMMCIGFYQHIPVDTETVKHLEKVHGKTKLNKKTQTKVIEEIYGKYAPYQCLAYWMEHVEYYEKNLGKLSELPHSQYRNVTTTNFQTRTSRN